MLREQALADLRELQRTLEMARGTWEAPQRYLTSVRNRDRLNHSLDLLQQAGEDVPPWLYKCGPLYPGALMNRTTGRPMDAVSLASVLGKITEARELFDIEASSVDPDPEHDADTVGWCVCGTTQHADKSGA